MKTLFLLPLFLLLIAGCTSRTTTVGPDPDPGGGGNQVWRGLTAKIDDAAWSAGTASASKQSGYTSITANADGSSIGITFNSVSAPRTITFSPSGATGVYSDGINVYSTDGNANAGTLRITEVDATHIAGTFSFTAAETQTSSLTRVTSGNFNVLF